MTTVESSNGKSPQNNEKRKAYDAELVDGPATARKKIKRSTPATLREDATAGAADRGTDDARVTANKDRDDGVSAADQNTSNTSAETNSGAAKQPAFAAKVYIYYSAAHEATSGSDGIVYCNDAIITYEASEWPIQEQVLTSIQSSNSQLKRHRPLYRPRSATLRVQQGLEFARRQQPRLVLLSFQPVAQVEDH